MDYHVGCTSCHFHANMVLRLTLSVEVYDVIAWHGLEREKILFQVLLLLKPKPNQDDPSQFSPISFFFIYPSAGAHLYRGLVTLLGTSGLSGSYAELRS
ncbi:hypothetical protein BHE74_00058769 [Ensete ventricosum]|nr:hypothetical protein BHE74_00058769 [Ensete ventricosum]